LPRIRLMISLRLDLEKMSAIDRKLQFSRGFIQINRVKDRLPREKQLVFLNLHP
jgi:hypothetical protein